MRGLDERILGRVEIRSRFERIQGGDRMDGHVADV